MAKTGKTIEKFQGGKVNRQNNILLLLDELRYELERAEAIHPTLCPSDPTRETPTKTPHGGYAVILEELDEFWEEVKKFNLPKGRDTRPNMRTELIQIAAMALRTIRDCNL
jgi:hypothetical protein